MITKEQALEFIYDLSQKTEIMLDISCGEMQFNRICDGDYSYTSFSGESTLEATVTKCIKEHMDAIMNYVDTIPVDVDMLEEGQTYKVEFLDYTGVLNSFTEKLLFLFITEEGETVFNFSNGYHTRYIDIKEIYKVNKHANM